MDWPNEILPLPFEAVDINNASNAIRTQMEGGFVRQRKRFSALNRQYSVRWMFNDGQVAMFQSFVKYKLFNGTAFFNIELRSGDFGLRMVSARIVGGNYNNSYSNGLYIVSATLEVQDAEVVPEEVYDFILGAGIAIADVFTMRDILHELVHVDLPEELLPPPPVYAGMDYAGASTTTSISVNPAEDFSFVWVGNPQDGGMVSIAGTGGTAFFLFVYYPGADRTLSFGSGGAFQVFQTVPNDTVLSIRGTYTASTGVWAVYVNGVLWDSTPGGAIAPETLYQTGAGDYTGLTKLHAYANRLLTEEEVTDIENDVSVTGLLAQYKSTGPNVGGTWTDATGAHNIPAPDSGTATPHEV